MSARSCSTATSPAVARDRTVHERISCRAAGTVQLQLHAQGHVGERAGRRGVRLSVGLSDAQGLVADGRRACPLHRARRCGRLYHRCAVRHRRVLRGHPCFAGDEFRQAAVAAARGRGDRPRLHRAVCARPLDGVDLAHLGQHPDHRARQHPCHRRRGRRAGRDHRRCLARDHGLHLEGSDGDLLRREPRAQHWPEHHARSK